jgi:hypothetical protein
VGFAGSDSLRVDVASRRVDIDSLRIDIATAADWPRREGGRRFGAALVLLSHAGHGQEWRDECHGKDVFDNHDFPPEFAPKYCWQVTALAALIFIKEA